MRASGSLITVLATTLTTALAAHAGTPVSWSTPASSFWDVAANWDPALVPGASDPVRLGLDGAYAVDVRFDQSAGALLISNPQAQLNIAVFRTLRMFGPVENHGAIVVNPTQDGAGASLRYETSSTLGGTGVLNLYASSPYSDLATASGAVVTHAAGHEIIGRGRVSAELVNNGTVSATVPGAVMTIDGSPKTNNALFRAVGGSILRFGATTISQGAQGLILADGPSSRVELSGPTVIGGSVRGQGGGVATVATDSHFNNVRTEGEIEIQVFRALSIQNTLTNAGRITVNPTAAGAGAFLRFLDGSTLAGDGEVVLAANSIYAQVSTADGASMTHGAGHTIRGAGRVAASMTNNGRINADRPDLRMEVFGAPKANNALMHATGGGILNLVDVTVNNGPGGVIRAEDGSRVELSNATVASGLLESTGSGRVVSVLDSTLNSVQTRGHVDVTVYRTMSVNGTLTNNGTITVNPTQAGAGTALHFADGAVLAGQGVVHLAPIAPYAQINNAPGNSLTHAHGHTIRGRGQVNAALTNNSLISADLPGGVMTITGQPKTNNAVMSAVNSGIMLLQSVTLNQTPGGTLVASGTGSVVELNTSTVNGGAIRTEDGGLIRVTNANAAVADASIDALLHIGVYRTLVVRPGTALNGRIIVNPTQAGAGTALHWDETFELGGDGVVTLGATPPYADITAAPDATAIIGPALRLEGIGRVNAPLTLRGTIAPGAAGVGLMHAAQPVTLTTTAVFEAEIASPSNADRLSSTSTFHADGTLSVHLLDGFNPADYWASVIVSAAGGVTGRFSQIIAPTPADPRLEIRARYFPTEIRVGAICKADFNADGLLNFFDISQFIADYNAGDPIADIAAPFGILNFFDIAEFMARYNTGCP